MLNTKKKYDAKLEDGTPVKFAGVTSSGNFGWEDESGKLHIPAEKSYKKKIKVEKNVK